MPNQPTEPTQDVLLQLRLPADIMTTIQRALEFTGETLNEFIVNSAHEAAESLIREQVIVLSPRDSILFAEAILNPEGLNEALREAARLHRELLGQKKQSES